MGDSKENDSLPAMNVAGLSQRAGMQGVASDYVIEAVKLIEASGEFDRSFYLAANEDVRLDGIDSIEHYVLHGSTEGRAPNLTFNQEHYLSLHSDVSHNSIPPFLHYINFGKKQRRPQAVDPGLHTNLLERRIVGRSFDYDLYDTRYPDVKKTGLDALTHFLSHGWREGKDPNAEFSCKAYIQVNPDVGEANVNPYLHYLTTGRREGRATRPMNTWQQALIAASTSTAARFENPIRDGMNPAAMRRERAAEVLALFLSKCLPRLIISFSHDDYLFNFGGIQNCVRREQEVANADGVRYLHVAPSLPTLKFSEQMRPEDTVILSVDGERVGHVYCAELSEVLSAAIGHRSDLQISLVVHSFLGHSRQIITDVRSALAVRHVFVWAHDCSTLCSNYALLRNDAEFCGGPKPDSWSCRSCAYGAERNTHLVRVSMLLRDTKATMLFPSRTMRDFWSRQGFHKAHDELTIPHATISFNNTLKPIEENKEKVRIAFVGAAVSHKGWNEYVTLSERFLGDCRYEFWHFGLLSSQETNIKTLPISVTSLEKNEMISALRDQDIDLVFQWTYCFETFSFTTYEALAAGCYILARLGSGNVESIIRSKSAGRLFGDLDEIISIFKGEEILDIVNTRRRTAIEIGGLRPSDQLSYLFKEKETSVA